MKLKDKVALVTGASRGLGKAIALKLAAEGARVTVNYTKSVDKAEEVVKEIISRGGSAAAMRADITSLPEVEKMVDSLYEQFGRIDILVLSLIHI